MEMLKEMNDMLTINATEARKEWSLTVDNVIREKPQFIKRTRDYMMLSNLDVIKNILEPYSFHAEKFIESDTSVTLSLDEIDLVENAPDENQAKLQLSKSILEYAEDFYNEFKYWSSDSSRKKHIPYILKALILNDDKKIGDLIQCRHGEN
jgi:antitoxin YefM